MGYNHERRYELSLKWKGERNRASLFFNDYQNLNGFAFKEENGVKYVRGADSVWVPLGSGIYYIADYGELTAYGTSPKTYTIPIPAYVKSRVPASVYNDAANYVGLADTVVGIAPGGIQEITTIHPH